ncbi:MAG: response regulator, partial [Thermodesulfobacteriota bacterium]
DAEESGLDSFLVTAPQEPEEELLPPPTSAMDSEEESGSSQLQPISTEEPEPLPLEEYTPPAALTSSTIDPELQESFDEEAEEHLDNIGRQLNELASSVNEPCPVNDEYRERLHSIRRSVHTLKGAAAVIGIEPVAAWGHDFEDFLDQLHDESDTLSPETIGAMQDGADILEKIATNPEVDVQAEIRVLLNTFPTITTSTGHREETGRQEISPKDVPAAILPQDSGEQFARAADTSSRAKRKQTRKRTLRVGSGKIAEVMGLSGDLAINLSSFENSASSMKAGLTELEMTLKRLKGIAAKLEAGYELSSIPHFQSGGAADQDQFGITEEFDPLEMDRYSELHILIRSLNEAVVDLDSIREQTFEVQDSWRLAVDRQRRVVNEVQSTVQAIQTTPFSTLANRLYRTVRESARSTEKNVRLLIDGGAMEMDTHVWDVLADALMHMLRNCVDHGVETEDERHRAGKPEQATIRISCSRRGSHFILRLADDGVGLDYDGIRSRALELYPGSGVEEMDDNKLAQLIFRQGFSIRSKVTSLSGRGVGMDVVRNALEQLNGSIETHSRQGGGTEFVLSMPIVVAQLPALLVMFGSRQFAVPMRDVERVIRLSDKELTADSLRLDDEEIPLLKPAKILGLEEGRAGNSLHDGSLALAVKTGSRQGVITADAVMGQRSIVYKSLGSHLRNVPCVSGATILGDGSLVPILQTEDLFSLADRTIQPGNIRDMERSSGERALEILIADDSISIRKVLSNFISSQGWHVTAAVDGVDAMEKIRQNTPDLILLDIEMPRMNGFEVLQTMQTQSSYRDIPVLMLTSRSAGKYRAKATELGASGFVTKPFKDEELLALITGLTGQKSRHSTEGEVPAYNEQGHRR